MQLLDKPVFVKAVARIQKSDDVKYVTPYYVHQHKQRIAEMLNALEWDFFMTLTFADPRTERVAYKHVRKFLEEQSPELAYFCLEHGERAGRLHAHAIMLVNAHSYNQVREELQRQQTIGSVEGNLHTLSRVAEELEETLLTQQYQADYLQYNWAKRFGIAQVKIAQKGKGGDYLTKYVTKNALENYDFVSKHEKQRTAPDGKTLKLDL